MSEELKAVAARIREMREICGYSHEDMAEMLGVAVSQYATYEEHGEDIPISVIYDISKKLGVELSDLLTGSSPKIKTLSVTKCGGGIKIDRYPGYSFKSLAYRFADKIMEPLLVTLDPKGERPALVSHGGQEFNYVLSGRVGLMFNDKEYILEEGDSVYFNPEFPHGQYAVGDETAEFLTVILNKE